MRPAGRLVGRAGCTGGTGERYGRKSSEAFLGSVFWGICFWGNTNYFWANRIATLVQVYKWRVRVRLLSNYNFVYRIYISFMGNCFMIEAFVLVCCICLCESDRFARVDGFVLFLPHNNFEYICFGPLRGVSPLNEHRCQVPCVSQYITHNNLLHTLTKW